MVHSITDMVSVTNNPHPIYNNSGEPRALRYFFMPTIWQTHFCFVSLHHK